ncbi:hypothetical protein [Curtobacterium flaccumfaciens]|uniref:hypothetical protein n=1 Tax=Curtobacterium flaccumfaciens TaxID=2035 RepID=UPI003EC0758C
MPRRLAAVAVAAVALSVTMTGCITINTGDTKSDEPPAAAPSSVPSPTGDHSGALEQLSYAIGALTKSSQPNATWDDCEYTAFTAQSMAGATPAPEWQGTYERITANMRNISGLCAADPANADARELAELTRPDVVEILNREKFNGLEDWS